jgi:hypothetical protein
MKIFSILAAVILFMLPASAMADSISDKLDGTWIETVQLENYPRTILHFNGRELRVENMYDNEITVEYAVTDKKVDEFTVSFEYRYMVKRGNGCIVEYRDAPDFLFHMENGRPILSQTAIELDGRGLIILNEFLPEKDFIDGFTSALKHRLNDRPAPPTYMMND